MQKINLIEGMQEKTARRYLEHTKKIDRALNQLMSLGKAIAGSTCSEIEIHISYFEDLGELVCDLALSASSALDECIDRGDVERGILKIDKPEDLEKLKS